MEVNLANEAKVNFKVMKMKDKDCTQLTGDPEDKMEHNSQRLIWTEGQLINNYTGLSKKSCKSWWGEIFCI